MKELACVNFSLWQKLLIYGRTYSLALLVEKDKIVLAVFDFFKNRRSIRTYSSKEVSKGVLFRILEATAWAPSAHNAQPWRFIVVTNAAVKRKLAENLASSWDADLNLEGVSTEKRVRLTGTSIERFTNAPIVIIVCLTRENMNRYPDKRRQKIEHIMAIQGVAAAIENMLLAVHAEGLGSCWFCAPLFCQNTVRKVLKIPSFIEPQALITIGYPAERLAPPKRKTVEEIAYRNFWGNLNE